MKRLCEAFKSPDKPENKDFLDVHRIESEMVLKKQGQGKNQMQVRNKCERVVANLILRLMSLCLPSKDACALISAIISSFTLIT